MIDLNDYSFLIRFLVAAKPRWVNPNHLFHLLNLLMIPSALGNFWIWYSSWRNILQTATNCIFHTVATSATTKPQRHEDLFSLWLRAFVWDIFCRKKR